MVTSQLSLMNHNQSQIISTAIDYYNNELKDINQTEKLFNKHTNYSNKVILKDGGQVIFLNHKYFSKGIYNGLIGMITKY